MLFVCLSFSSSVLDASPPKLLDRFGGNCADGWRSAWALRLSVWRLTPVVSKYHDQKGDGSDFGPLGKLFDRRYLEKR